MENRKLLKNKIRDALEKLDFIEKDLLKISYYINSKLGEVDSVRATFIQLKYFLEQHKGELNGKYKRPKKSLVSKR